MGTNLEKSIKKLVTPAPLIAGNVKLLKSHCGKAGCKCMREKNPEKHPYYQLSYSKDNKTITMYIKRNDVEKIKTMTENYKEFRRASLDIGYEMLLLCKKYGVKKAYEVLEMHYQRVITGKKFRNCDTGKFRQLKESCDKWKNKAKERHKELEKNRIKIRDLKKSRSCWKVKAFNARVELRDAQKKLRAKEREIEKLRKENKELKKNVKRGKIY